MYVTASHNLKFLRCRQYFVVTVTQYCTSSFHKSFTLSSTEETKTMNSMCTNQRKSNSLEYRDNKAEIQNFPHMFFPMCNFSTFYYIKQTWLCTQTSRVLSFTRGKREMAEWKL